MKTVFSGDMVFHVWANQSAPHGRRSDGRVYFEGRALYSYGSHFCLGYVMPDGVTLLNSDSYSVSTSKHQGQTRNAARGATHRVPNLTRLVQSYALSMLERGGNDKAEIKRARESIVRFVTENALGFESDESALYLLNLAKRPRAWASIKAKAIKARDAKRAADAKSEHAQKVRDARRMGEMSERDFSDWIARRLESPAWGRFDNGRGWKEYRKATQAETLATIATELRRAKRVAASDLGKRINATLAARVKAVADKAKHAAKWESVGDDLAAWIATVGTARELWRERMARGPLSREANNRLKQAVQWLLAHDRAALITAKGKASLAAIVANCDALEAQEVERENRERMEREREARESWLAGIGSRHVRFSDEQGGAMLRAVDVERDDSGAIIEGTLQTSHGADVPLVHALKAFAFVRRVVTTGGRWQANGHTIRVGHFRVDSISSDGTMKAGCHVIHLAEMERLAGELGVAGIAASDEALEESGHAR